MAESFLYFGFASNLLKERIGVRCPEAKFRTIATLKDYKVVFRNPSTPNHEGIWHGATATIVPSTGGIVWGAVWEIGNEYLDALNREDFVDKGVFRNFEVTVMTPDNKPLKCCCFQMCDPLPEPGFPSPHYLSVIVDGAIQRGLPEDYIAALKATPDNGYQGKVNVMDDIVKNKTK
ncbi:gamma-glutamylcyclotransferase-like [Saccoglossus kowalevskii]|uniref:gamma-glutamylcyclotransferase n=1 Tax=Saccoglossus kowalevskii TaxID=10224 RepID=A0ABM0GUZ6_SACKO|nr:PREDICTED: gamma-glutamylcyclotransferase-like [Saccoglossus kowalevskii]